MQTTQFDIEIRTIDSIRPYVNNPRMDDQTVGAVTTSMSGYEFRQSVVDSDGAITVGHKALENYRKHPPEYLSITKH